MAAGSHSAFAERMKRAHPRETTKKFAELVEERITTAKHYTSNRDGLVFTIELPEKHPCGSPFRNECIDKLVERLHDWSLENVYAPESMMYPGTYWFEGKLEHSCGGLSCQKDGCPKGQVDPKAALSVTLIVCISHEFYRE